MPPLYALSLKLPTTQICPHSNQPAPVGCAEADIGVANYTGLTSGTYTLDVYAFQTKNSVFGSQYAINQSLPFFVRPAWAHFWRCKSSRKLATANEVKRNCGRVTDPVGRKRAKVVNREPVNKKQILGTASPDTTTACISAQPATPSGRPP